MKLRQLKTRPYVPLRYENVYYHSSRKVAVDVIVYNDPNYKKNMVSANSCILSRFAYHRYCSGIIP
ncbi:MAG: hypothetical protein HY578_04770 [Nitrospinae bacterium]|nr:hypothetical protein [Nitrospinota bacterium]